MCDVPVQHKVGNTVHLQPNVRADAGLTPNSCRTRAELVCTTGDNKHRVLVPRALLWCHPLCHPALPDTHAGLGLRETSPPAAGELKRRGWESVRSAAVRYGAR